MIRQRRQNKIFYRDGQFIIEFAFSMIIVLLMIYGTMMVFRWAGKDLGMRRINHDFSLTRNVVDNYGGPCPLGVCVGDINDGPLNQIDPYYHKPTKMQHIFSGN